MRRLRFPFELVRLIAVTLALASSARAQHGAVGLSPVGSQFLPNEDFGVFLRQHGDLFGYALATGDFNGDGADDLATGVPKHDNVLASQEDSGVVVVRYGARGSGFSLETAESVLTQFVTGSPDPAEPGDLFGFGLVACDFDGDGFDDLAVGVPGEDVAGVASAGGVEIHYGSAAGLAAAGDQFFTAASPGVPGVPSPFALFGAALACGDFDFVGLGRDGFPDLAVGVSGEPVETFANAGVVIVLAGTTLGLTGVGAVRLRQGAAGLEGEPEGGESFGHDLATGDFDGDGFDDLAVSVPFEDGGGAVQLLRGFDLAQDVLLLESLLGGVTEPGDGFGYSIAAGDLDGDGFDDLAIGVPFEDFDGGAIDRGGQVVAVYGAAGGVDPTRSQFWLENLIYGFGTTEAFDEFGRTVAVGDFDRDGFDDLVAAHPGEFTLVEGDGVVTVVMGTPTGLGSGRYRGFTSGHEGVPGPASQPLRHVGEALAVGDFDGDGHDDLVFGAPVEDDGGLLDVGATRVVYGSIFSDGFETATPGYWSVTAPRTEP